MKEKYYLCLGLKEGARSDTYQKLAEVLTAIEGYSLLLNNLRLS